MKKMKVIISTKYGSPDVLQLHEVEKPIPKNNEILIKVIAASVTTADCMMRTGFPLIGRLFLGITKPKNPVPGSGFAGIIEATGNDVKLFEAGDQIFGESIVTFGANAEYLCIPENGLISIKPNNITFEDAASICDGALTSLNFLKNIGNVKKGQKVLIIGAAGSLGTAAVQLAKYFGAEVTGVCSRTNIKLVKELGAEKVIDYTSTDFTKSAQIYDIIYDTVGKSSFTLCKNSLTKNGVYISPVLGLPLLINMIGSSMFGRKKAKFSATGILPVPKLQMLLKELKLLIELGKLTSVLDRSYSLERISDAHRYIDKGHKKGNVVIPFNQ